MPSDSVDFQLQRFALIVLLFFSFVKVGRNSRSCIS
jgi:hypothetical protein